MDIPELLYFILYMITDAPWFVAPIQNTNLISGQLIVFG